MGSSRATGHALENGGTCTELGDGVIGGDLDGFLKSGDVAANGLSAFWLSAPLAVEDCLDLEFDFKPINNVNT